MKTREFYFDLPENLIAQNPPERRGESRLMRLDRRSGRTSDHTVADLPKLLAPGSLLVFNDTRVRRARLYGVPVETDAAEAGDSAAAAGNDTAGTDHGDTSAGSPPAEPESHPPRGAVEFLLLDPLASDPGRTRWRCMVSRTKRQRPGRRYRFPGGVEAVIAEVDGQFRIVEFRPNVDDGYLERFGHVPLPPYIRRDDLPEDADRYQTVYARETGSAAAPTAGLHFTPDLLDELTASGFESCFVTLHVGLGTFLPVRAEEIDEHRMHTERFRISPETAERVERARGEKRPVVAVGTTSVRTLEAAWTGSGLRTGWQQTDIFIHPGYQWRVVDAIFTNFHTPESTLLMLVSAFAGRENVLSAYRGAVERRYRFFSYGDAMLIQ